MTIEGQALRAHCTVPRFLRLVKSLSLIRQQTCDPYGGKRSPTINVDRSYRPHHQSPRHRHRHRTLHKLRRDSRQQNSITAFKNLLKATHSEVFPEKGANF